MTVESKKAIAIAKRASDVITLTNSDKQTGMAAPDHCYRSIGDCRQRVSKSGFVVKGQ